jgi:cell division protein FtsN
MVRQNQYHSNQRKPKNQGNGQLLMIIVAFATGYMSSTIVDMNHLGAMLNQSLAQWGWHAKHQNIKASSNTPQLAHQPKLEFYTVLAQKTEHKVPIGTDLQKMVKPTEIPEPPTISSKLAAEPKKNTVTVEVAQAAPKISEEKQNVFKKGQYVVQLASFRYYTQAEKFRAKLLLKGFDVRITSISRGSLQWYRVMLGPFNNQLEAQKAQHAYQTREHTSGMVKPVDV